MMQVPPREGASPRLRLHRLQAVHYYTAPWDDWHDGTPPLVMIGVRAFEPTREEVFSIHRIAELQGIPPPDIPDKQQELERAIIEQFYSHLKAHRKARWLHWKMNSAQFGFAAIAHRHRVLGGSPPDVPPTQTVDFADALRAHYGEDYAPHPRLPSLARLNGVSELDSLSISELSQFHREGKFALMERSLCRRLRVLTCLFAKFAAGTLKHTGVAVGDCPLRTALTKTSPASTAPGGDASVSDPFAMMKGKQRKLVMAVWQQDFCPIERVTQEVYGQAWSLKVGAFTELLKRTREKLLDVAPQYELIRIDNRLKLKGPQDPTIQERTANDQGTPRERQQGQIRGTMTERK
jgi:hypothetical protein